MNQTTKRFARTMHEAFPFGPEYGCAITRYERWDGHRLIVPVCFLAAVFVFVLLALGC